MMVRVQCTKWFFSFDNYTEELVFRTEQTEFMYWCRFIIGIKWSFGQNISVCHGSNSTSYFQLMIILNAIYSKLFVELGTRGLKMINLRTFFNSFYSILDINWHREQWGTFSSQQTEAVHVRCNHSPDFKCHNYWLRTHLLRRKSVTQCLLKEFIEYCTFHKITAKMAILLSLKDSMFFCKMQDKKFSKGRQEISKNLIILASQRQGQKHKPDEKH